jgi:hypothetical protein
MVWTKIKKRWGNARRVEKNKKMREKGKENQIKAFKKIRIKTKIIKKNCEQY